MTLELTGLFGYDIRDKNVREEINNINNKIKGHDSQFQTIANELGDETLQTNSQDLKGAINEVFQYASNGKGLIATAITGKGVDASSSDTFAQLATKIQQISGSSIASDTALGQKMYSFAVVSDIHYGRTDYNVEDDTNKMLEGLEGLNIDFVCGCGDLVVDSPNTRIPTFKTLWDSKCTKTFYSCTGNHDATVTESVWQQNIGHGFRHSFEKNGDVFLFMSVDNDVTATGSFSDLYGESMDWLATKMQEYKGKRIFMFMHYPLYGYSGLRPNQAYGFTSSSTESSTIAGYLSNIENLMIFSGHSHQPFYLEKEDAKYNHLKFYEINSHNSATIGMPSIGLPRNFDLSYITDTNPIEGMVVDVYEKGVIFRGYDFVNNDYMDEYTYYLQVENNNAINIDVSVEQISINETDYADFTVKLNREIENDITVYLVNSNDYISLNKSNLTFTKDNWNVEQTVRVTASHQADNYDTLLSNISLSCEGANSKNITVTVNNIDVPPVTYYSVGKTLTGCTLSNSATQVEENTNYSANINLEENYKIQSVTVTMGGIDITSTAYNSSNNSISISSVTGNIEISITCIEEDSRKTVVYSKETVTGTIASSSQYINIESSDNFVLPTPLQQGVQYYAKAESFKDNEGNDINMATDKIYIWGIPYCNGSKVTDYIFARYTDIVSAPTIMRNVNNVPITKNSNVDTINEFRIKISSSATVTLPITVTLKNFEIFTYGETI